MPVIKSLHSCILSQRFRRVVRIQDSDAPRRFTDTESHAHEQGLPCDDVQGDMCT